MFLHTDIHAVYEYSDRLANSEGADGRDVRAAYITTVSSLRIEGTWRSWLTTVNSLLL
jgi:hypothetical protein